ncbi:uncharacterized protein LOC131294585 [Anopheles ziemanni]|uniref:uncharacterized protein LOC131265203 n=1 Tax=Anopheles coustani TaxID=139045 RepID=UPI002657C063|nr:uncharacterized protein LOC131265203 [Anopheles coustani]XP_058178613.1 uncharacterized protein LOC131294585 [Anopheles ziemanni]
MVNSSCKMSQAALLIVGTFVLGSLAGLTPLGKERPRTLQMIGATNPRMLHRISADLQPDTSKVVHIQVPYYIDRPKVRTKKFKPWIPRGHRFATSGGHLPVQQLSIGTATFGSPFPREIPLKGIPIGATGEFLQTGGAAGGSSGPGPYDTPFVPVMKPSPVNPLHPPERPTPEIMFEPISILPLEAPSFETLRNHVNFLKQKQQAFFEGQGREFGFSGAIVPEELDYFGKHHGGAIHNGDVGDGVEEGERNTLSEDDFGQNDRKYDRRGKVLVGSEEAQSGEADFYDSDGKQYSDDDFEDSREEADRVAAFEPKKVYTQVRHQETIRHVPRREQPEEEEEDYNDDGARDNEDEEEDDEGEEGREEDGDDDDEEEDDEGGGNRAYALSKGSDHHQPIKERVKEHRKNIVYSEKGREAQKFDHGSEERFGEFEQNQTSKPRRDSKKSKRNRIKRSEPEGAKTPSDAEERLRSEVVDVLAYIILGNASNITSLPQPEALTDPRELQGEELLRFLDEAIQNTTQYLPEPALEGGEVISIVSPPRNVVKFPYYNRPASEIDVDSALRYAENLTTFSGGLYGSKAGGVECNEVDVELEDEPEPIAEGGSDNGFRPIKRLKGLGDKIDCLKAKHFGREPLDNPLFREEFVGSPRKAGSSVVTLPQQPNPAVAVYNDVIRHIKKHLASQQRNKNSKSDTDQDTVMIAVPRVLNLDADGDSSDDRFTIDVGRRREPRLAFPQANPLPVSNHISVPIFDISKYVPRFMMRANDDLFADDLEDAKLIPLRPRPTTPAPFVPVTPRLSTPKVRLQTLVKTAEQLAEGAVAVEEGVERQLTTAQPVRDDIADAFDDVITKRPEPPAPLPPIHQYSVVEQDPKDGDPEPTFNKSGPPYAALALEPPVAQSILKQRIAPIERNQLDFHKGKKRSPKIPARKSRRPTGVTRKKVLVFYH